VGAGTPHQQRSAPLALPMRAGEPRPPLLLSPGKREACDQPEEALDGSWPKVRKQRTPDSSIGVWELSKFCLSKDAFGAPASTQCSGDYVLEETPLMCGGREKTERTGRFGLHEDFRRCPMPDDETDGLAEGSDDDHISLTLISSNMTDDSSLDDEFALVQLEAFAAEAMGHQGLHGASKRSAPLDHHSLTALSEEQSSNFQLPVGAAAPTAPRDAHSSSWISTDLDAKRRDEARLIHQYDPRQALPRPFPVALPHAFPSVPQQVALSRAHSHPAFSNALPTADLGNTPVATPPLLGCVRSHGMAEIRPSAAAVERQLGGRSPGSKVTSERREWTAAEDEIIKSNVAAHGCRWRRIAELLPGRSDDAVRNRWNRLKESDVTLQDEPQSPATDSCDEQGSDCGSISTQARTGSALGRWSPTIAQHDKSTNCRTEKKKTWTAAEDALVVDSVKAFGHKWNKIAEILPGRTDHAIRNRWQRLLKIEAQAENSAPRHVRSGIRGDRARMPAVIGPPRPHAPPEVIIQRPIIFPQANHFASRTLQSAAPSVFRPTTVPTGPYGESGTALK